MFLLRHLRKGLRQYEACYKTSEDSQAGLAAVCIYADPADMGNHFLLRAYVRSADCVP